MLGLALHPVVRHQPLVYLIYTALGRGRARSRGWCGFARSGNALGEAAVLLDDVPAANIHNGSRVKFGPDGCST